MAADLERRKSVMSRSFKLGHCVCNPKQGCPCEIFKLYNVCQCAGERLPVKEGNIALTKNVKKAGCASKIGQADLKRILKNLPEVKDPNVLLGCAAGDDAGVYKINNNLCLVQTVDVFSPCVDDPYLFGQIAAANSLSDAYAMGAKPVSALSIVGFPIDDISGEILEAILSGGIDKMNEAGCSIIGGHSINDDEIKCGFAITALIDSDKFVKRDNAREGDALVLTKPLGTGILSFASQIGKLPEEALAHAGKFMASLNKDAAELMIKYNANACTDITGFGLMGHLSAMIEGSGVSAEIDFSALPVFASVSSCIDNDIFPGAIESNMEYSIARLDAPEEMHKSLMSILFDPQTSGGLLVSLPPDSAEKYTAEMKSRGYDEVSVIGKIIPSKAGRNRVKIINPVLKNLIGTTYEILSADSGKSQDKNDSIKISKANKSAEISSSAKELQPCCAQAPEEINPDKIKKEAAASSSVPPTTASSPTSDASASSQTSAVSPSSPTSSTTASSAPSSSSAADEIPEYKRKFSGFMQEISKPQNIDVKNKKLMAVALSVATRCHQCAKLHIQTAVGLGITKSEIDEAAYYGIMFAGAPSMMFYNEIMKELGLG